MLFASGLVVEREPLGWAGAPAAIAEWVRDVGMAAAVIVVIWTLIGLGSRRRYGTSVNLLLSPAFWYSAASAALLVLYGIAVALLLIRRAYTPLEETLLTIAGAIALSAAAFPAVLALVTRTSPRRVWALALLSIKEAVRGRVLYVFAAFALLFLFLGYFVPTDANQINTYTKVIFWPLTIIFVVLAALLGSFSIPRDVVKQTIHTIVTKPVERYEIVLGRFLGNGVLLTVCLFVLTAISVGYLGWQLRGESPSSAEEKSYTARVPLEPDRLTFQGTGKEERGESVGREWDYRSYIRGRTLQNAGQPRQYAIWWFRGLPASLGERSAPIPFEYTFDIYRTTKAETGKEGVYCNLIFADGALPVAEVERRVRLAEQERKDLLEKAPKRGSEKEDFEALNRRIEDQLIQRHRVYQARDVFVVDYHIGKLKVPASLFKTLQEKLQGGSASRQSDAPELKVWLSVGEDRNSSQQMLGVAKRDLYLLSGELPFWQNFFKGAVGLWMLTLFVLGVALACSTYLSGVISLLCTFFLVGAALLRDFIFELGSGRAAGGGPVEAGWRIFNHLPIASPFEQSPAASVGHAVDAAYTWLWHFLRNLVPDIYRFNLTDYVASGFDIPWARVLLWDNFVPLVGYLLPLAILAYYLMRAREIANPS
jgi:ABC-type transport system involved in multi-copper enzyme maturation permease subunit